MVAQAEDLSQMAAALQEVVSQFNIGEEARPSGEVVPMRPIERRQPVRRVV
jgi:hypothetical protein